MAEQEPQALSGGISTECHAAELMAQMVSGSLGISCDNQESNARLMAVSGTVLACMQSEPVSTHQAVNATSRKAVAMGAYE